MHTSMLVQKIYSDVFRSNDISCGTHNEQVADICKLCSQNFK